MLIPTPMQGQSQPREFVPVVERRTSELDAFVRSQAALPLIAGPVSFLQVLSVLERTEIGAIDTVARGGFLIEHRVEDARNEPLQLEELGRLEGPAAVEEAEEAHEALAGGSFEHSSEASNKVCELDETKR